MQTVMIHLVLQPSKQLHTKGRYFRPVSGIQQILSQVFYTMTTQYDAGACSECRLAKMAVCCEAILLVLAIVLTIYRLL